jgi:hypothetical protein
MLRVFIRLLALVALFVLLIAGIGSLLPREYSFEQSTLIAAPTDVVFGRVNDLHYWLKWSPWRTETLWFTESDPPVRIAYEMVFAQFRDTRGEFLLVDRGEMTEVTWKSRGRLPSGPFYGYLRGLYRSGMERQFQLSLQRLKTECEALVAKK